MYNRYIPTENRYETVGTGGGYRRYSAGSAQEYRRSSRGPVEGECTVSRGSVEGKGGLGSLLGGLGDGLGDGIGQAVNSLLKTLHLENIDTGDILLALIVLFLILEDGDNLDLIITLGLMILFSLGEP